MIRVIIVGAGGHGRVVSSAGQEMAESTPDVEIVGFADSNFKADVDTLIDGSKIIANDDGVAQLLKDGVVTHYCLGIGTIKGGEPLRQLIVQKYTSMNLAPYAIIHPTAIVASSAEIEPGAFVGAGAIINPGAKIGAHSIINSGAIVEHDCTIGAFSHIAPGAVLSGNCVVGENTLIGSGSAVRQGMVIGANVTIGAGSVVVKPLLDGETVSGNPASKM